MKAHIHSELMMEYAKDAMETDKPWLRWEFRSQEDDWKSFAVPGPSWNEESEYRRKVKMININGHEVPEPYRGEMKFNQPYCVPWIGSKANHYDTKLWGHYLYDNEVMSLGLVHLNPEAAIIHSLALLSFTEL
jgi:hypothetical protein